MSFHSGYPGQAPGASYQGFPQGGFPQAGAVYQGVPQQGYPGASSPYQQPAQQQGYPGAASPYQQPGQGYPGQQQQQQQQQQQGYAQPGVSPEIMNWFRAVDQDNSGFINAEELSRALQSGNNKNFSVQACHTMMSMFDHQRTGRINVQQFAQLFEFINQWTEAFRRADSDSSGSISVHELEPVLRQQGYNISASTIQVMVQKFGQPGGGSYQPAGGSQSALGLDGFILVCVQLRRLTDVFRQKDVQQQGRITIGYEDFINMVVSTVA